jgi:hypothetical protein
MRLVSTYISGYGRLVGVRSRLHGDYQAGDGHR